MLILIIIPDGLNIRNLRMAGPSSVTVEHQQDGVSEIIV